MWRFLLTQLYNLSTFETFKRICRYLFRIFNLFLFSQNYLIFKLKLSQLLVLASYDMKYVLHITKKFIVIINDPNFSGFIYSSYKFHFTLPPKSIFVLPFFTKGCVSQGLHFYQECIETLPRCAPKFSKNFSTI